MILQKHKYFSYHANSVDSSFWLYQIFVQEIDNWWVKTCYKGISASNVTCLETYLAQKHIIGIFPSAECDEISHITDGTYSKCILVQFISDALDWCYGDVYKFSHAHKGFMLMPNKQAKRKFNKKVCAKGKWTSYTSLELCWDYISFQSKYRYIKTKKMGNKLTQNESNQRQWLKQWIT